MSTIGPASRSVSSQAARSTARHIDPRGLPFSLEGSATSRETSATPAIEAWVVSEPYAGLQAQGLGLVEAAAFRPVIQSLQPRFPWRYLAARLWPRPLAALPEGAMAAALPPVVVGCGGAGAVVAAALRRRGSAAVQVQHPRIDIRRFDVVLAARHDGLSGPNVVVTRTALHRVTPTRLADAAARWAGQLSCLPRPLVAVLVGGDSGRYRFGRREAAKLAHELAAMMEVDRVGLALTPSRRTGARELAILRQILEPRGAWIWDGTGENPYFGLLALADVIVVTIDSVSMVSEAVATSAPVMLARLPGHSSRQHVFMQALMNEGRVREFKGRLDHWPVEPIDDTAEAAAETRRRLGL
jgi:mitochondrial fission protein ELM1